MELHREEKREEGEKDEQEKKRGNQKGKRVIKPVITLLNKNGY